MQVLEMEDVEALIGNSNRKRMGSSRNKKSNKLDLVLSFCQGDMLPKVIVAACVILIGLLYVSSQDDPTPAIDIVTKSPGSIGDIVDSTAEITVPSHSTTEPQRNPTESPTVSDTTTPPTDLPTSSSTSSAVDNPSEDSEEKNAFKYSKYATILPLVDHPLPSEEEKEALADKFGKWHFWDGEEDERPLEDYTSIYPNRDMPGDEFSDYAWQADAVYVNHILNDADQLISRTMEAIFIEYGHGKPLPPEGA